MLCPIGSGGEAGSRPAGTIIGVGWALRSAAEIDNRPGVCWRSPEPRGTVRTIRGAEYSLGGGLCGVRYAGLDSGRCWAVHAVGLLGLLEVSRHGIFLDFWSSRDDSAGFRHGPGGGWLMAQQEIYSNALTEFAVLLLPALRLPRGPIGYRGRGRPSSLPPWPRNRLTL